MSLPTIQLERAQELVNYATTHLILDPSTLPKDKVLHLLRNFDSASSKYEDMSQKLLDMKYEIQRTFFPFNQNLEKELILLELDETSSDVLKTLKALSKDTRKQRSPQVLKETATLIPVFNGTIEPWTWPQWIQIFEEFLENHDVVFTDLNLNYLKKALSDEPLKVVNMLGSSISAQEALSHLGKIYGNEENILREILRAIRKIRLPHYKRQQWQRLETQTQRLQKLLQKVPSGDLCHEIVREVEICLPLEKREELTLGLKVRSQDQHISFIYKILKDIEDFANYSAKKFYQARYTCLNYDPDDEVHSEDPDNEEDSDSDEESSNEDPEDQVDLEAWERELEEKELEEREWQRRVRNDEEEERRALVVPSDEEEENRDEGHSFYFY